MLGEPRVVGSPLSHCSEQDGNRFGSFCAFFGMKVFLRFDCVPLCSVFFRRSFGGRAPPFVCVFEAETIQHVDSLSACEWRGDAELPWHSLSLS